MPAGTIPVLLDPQHLAVLAPDHAPVAGGVFEHHGQHGGCRARLPVSPSETVECIAGDQGSVSGKHQDRPVWDAVRSGKESVPRSQLTLLQGHLYPGWEYRQDLLVPMAEDHHGARGA